MIFPTLKRIITTMRAKGYKVFENDTPADVNIVGIRSDNVIANSFDDLICVFYKNSGRDCVLYFSATTDPGKYWLKHPMHEEGTAILKPGQYRGAFKIGKHQNKYPALVQKEELTVYRDNDFDDSIDTEGMIEDTGKFGINIHCASHKGKSIEVGKWSAGCQVIADGREFLVFMALMEYAKETFGNSFTYTLLEESDLL